MNCNPDYSNNGGFNSSLLATSSFNSDVVSLGTDSGGSGTYDNGNGVLDYWEGQEMRGGFRYCSYSDGTVINVGNRFCPSTI